MDHTEYANAVSGEVKTKADWMAEIISEGYHLQGDDEATPEQYWAELVENRGFVRVD